MGMYSPIRSAGVYFFNWPSLVLWALLTGALMYIYGWHFILYGLMYRILVNVE